MRLIDADKLIEKLKSYAECDWNKSLYTMLPSVVDDCIEFVDEQPNSYSVDNVVAELEKIRAKKTCNKEKCDTKEICRICVVDDAIEIVKHGGVSDDVCEWKMTDTKRLMPYKTSCGNEDLYDNSYKYCPYCGKKILCKE